MSRRIRRRRRLSDDALCSSRRERERRKGESLPRFCCRATTPFWVLLPPSRGKKAKSDENREREREKVSSSWEEKKYGEKKCRSRGGQTMSKNAHELHILTIYTICWIHTVEENVFRTTTTTTTLQNAHHDEEEEEKALKSVIAPPQTWTTTHPASFVSFVASRTRPS